MADERGVPLEKFQEMAAADPSVDRLVDQRTMQEAETGDVVIDGQLAGWVLREISDLRVLLTAPLVVRLERIASRDHISLEEAQRRTLHRERVQAERYRKHYGFNVNDWTLYHLVLDTSFGSIEDTSNILRAAALASKNARNEKELGKDPRHQSLSITTGGK
jgi:cytidylate kinase